MARAPRIVVNPSLLDQPNPAMITSVSPIDDSRPTSAPTTKFIYTTTRISPPPPRISELPSSPPTLQTRPTPFRRHRIYPQESDPQSRNQSDPRHARAKADRIAFVPLKHVAVFPRTAVNPLILDLPPRHNDRNHPHRLHSEHCSHRRPAIPPMLEFRRPRITVTQPSDQARRYDGNHLPGNHRSQYPRPSPCICQR